MRKLLLVAVLGLISFAICFAAEPPGREYGVGSPYSITASATGVIYRDLNTGVLWQANSTTKGDWSKLTPQVADGSASAPYNTLYVTTINDGAVVSMTAAEKDQALNGTATLDFAATSINGVNVFTAAERTQALAGSTTVAFEALSINGVTPLTDVEKTQALVGSSSVDFVAKDLTANSASIATIINLSPLTEDPAAPSEGTIYHNGASHTLNIYLNATWNSIDLTPYP